MMNIDHLVISIALLLYPFCAFSQENLPVPYPPLNGSYTGSPVRYSPDPLGSYRWSNPKATDGLQIYKYIDSRSPNRLTSWGRGDWVPVKSHSTKELMSSIYYYVDTKILADAAQLFGKQDDYQHYSALAQKIRNAINGKYLNRQTGVYANGTQTEQSMPLMWGVVPDDMRLLVADNLAKKVQDNGFHLDVGVHGAKALLFALSENGHAETAYKVAAQDKYPSWGS